MKTFIEGNRKLCQRGYSFCISMRNTHIVWDKYELYVLLERVHNPERWEIVYPDQSSEWLEKSNAISSWKPDELRIYYARVLEKTNPDVAKFINKVKFQIGDISGIMRAVGQDNMDPEEYASEWIKNNAHIFNKWLD